ncbi:MAG: ArnT family glycosyltransferase [Planctomycetaceae bacterium]
MDARAKTRRWLMRVIAGALLLRVIAAVGLQVFLDSRDPPRRFLIEGDAEGYWDLAGDLAARRDYAVYTPPRRILRMPGFPLVLALPRLCFGDHLFPARLWLACVGTLACWGVYRLGAVLVDDVVGLLAASLAAVSPVFNLFTPVILSETTSAAAMLLSLIPAARLWRQLSLESEVPPATARLAILTGLGMAAATYVRPSWLLVGPGLGVALLIFQKRRWQATRDAVLVTATLIAALVPWALRNQSVTGHFVLTSLWMGPSLYDGLNPEATGDSNMAFFDRDNLLSRMSEYEVNAHYKDEAWRYAREHPEHVLQLAVAKLWRYWKPWPNAEQFRNMAAIVGVGLVFVIILALAIVGAWQSRADVGLLLLTAGPILYFSAVHLFFVSSLRYRLPAEYPLLVLSGIGLRAWLSQSLPAGTGLGVPLSCPETR